MEAYYNSQYVIVALCPIQLSLTIRLVFIEAQSLVLGIEGGKRPDNLALSHCCETQWLCVLCLPPSLPMTTVLVMLKADIESSSYLYTRGLNWNVDDTR